MPAFNDVTATLLKRFNTAKNRRTNFDILWQEIADYMVPRKTDIITRFTQGTKRTIQIFDGTVLGVIEVAVSAIDGTLTPSTIRWFSLRVEGEDNPAIEDMNNSLSHLSSRMFTALNNSNFKAEMQETYEDLLVFGTNCLFIDEAEPVGSRFGGLRFEAMPPGSYTIAEDGQGLVDTVYSEFTMSMDAAIDRFGLENLSPETQRKARDHSAASDHMLSFVHCAFPKKRLTNTGVQDIEKQDKEILSIYMEVGTTQAKDIVGSSNKIVDVGGYDSLPYIVSRWRKSSGEQYGRCPGMNALPDVRTLNEAVKLRLQQWQLAIRPPLGVSNRGVLGQLNLTPGSINSFQGNPADSFKEMLTGARFDVASFQEEQLRAAIRSRFFVDQIQFPPMEGTPVTATEFQGRFEMMQRILGPILGRLEYELLTPILRRVFTIMDNANVLERLDQEILDAAQILFEGPLARTQRTSDVEAVNRSVAILQAIAAQGQPEAMDAMDMTEIGKFIPERLGVPAHLIRDSDEIEAIQRGRQQAQEEAANREALTEESKAASNIAPIVDTINNLGQRQPVESGV